MRLRENSLTTLPENEKANRYEFKAATDGKVVNYSSYKWENEDRFKIKIQNSVIDDEKLSSYIGRYKLNNL